MKKLISIILALSMALSMALSLCVTTTWADDVTVVNNLAGLQAAITAKKPNIKLDADIVIDPTTAAPTTTGGKSYRIFTVEHELTLDLNGHKICYDQTKEYVQATENDAFDIFSLVSGAKMTVTGNGTVNATIKGNTPTMRLYSFCFRLKENASAALTIENGTFLRDVPSTAGGDMSDYDVVFVHNGGGTVTINGGYFAITGHSGIVLNVAGDTADGKRIYVNGGTVEGQLAFGASKEITPKTEMAIAVNNDKGNIHYFGSDAIAAAVNNGEDVTVTTGGEINGVKGGSIKVANGVTGVKINGVPVETSGDTTEPITIELWTVSFMDGDTVLNKVGIVKGSQLPVERPADPTKVGYIFVRWNDVNGEEYDFDATVNTDLLLMAEWEPAVSGHEPIRRQHTTAAVEDITADIGADDAGIDTVTSAKTADIGVAVYGVMAVLSMTGSVWVVGRKRR